MWEWKNEDQAYDELYHYGVLGMKWGIRRAYNKGEKYEYKSYGQKKFQKKYDKLRQKIKDNKDNYSDKSLSRMKNKMTKTKNTLEMYKARDKSRVDYAKTANIGKSILKTVLMGPVGHGSYNRLRSAGQGRVVSAVGGVLTNFATPVMVGVSKGAENASAYMRAKGEGKIKEKKGSKKFNAYV